MRRLASTAIVAAVAWGCSTAPVGDHEPAGDTTSPPTREAQICGPEITEPLDPSSSLHLLPGAAEPAYRSDPPTSGAHLSGPAPAGALDEPIGRPVQVQVIEQGGVVIQYRALAPSEVDRLETLAGPQVVVAPNPDLPAAVVATAWTTKRSCEALDVEALRQFIADHRAVEPAHS
ncbi:MAG: DUF3105 domain-containing protein [Actinobacteria bacterium]|nr:DUF3105 domain-containing protein [Actinomycetota bacterium]